MPLYPKSFIQRLRDEIPVSQVIGARVPLKKKGREFEACCPFHQEKSPSFTVNDPKGFYHCFGCSAHGDALKFLMEYEKLTYPQAIESLAREGGIALPEISPEAERQERKRSSLQDVMTMADHWFRQQLSLSQGQAARDYLAQRGLTAETIQHFGLGYAPEDRNALKTYLQDEGVEEAQMVEAGLLIQLEDRSRPSYSRFRDRIMFPITNLQGDTIAFGGRLMQASDTAPKYLNSPETPLFHKGHVLYNWRNAKQAARDDAPIIVAEGYMDVIALHQFGFHTAVAPLGTALTETHLKGIWRYQDDPILCLDGDTAGQRAMWRSAELALPHLEPGKTLRFLTLPQGQDPDDFLKSNGRNAFIKAIAQTVPLSQVVLETVNSRYGNDTPEQRAAAEAEINKLCDTIQNESVKHHFRQFFREQRYAQKSRSFTPGAKGRQSYNKQAKKTPQALPHASTRHAGLLRAQKELIKLLLIHPDLCEKSEICATLETLELGTADLSEIQHWLLESAHPPSYTPQIAKDLLADATVILPEDAVQKTPEKLFHRLVDSMTLARIDQEMQLLQREMTTDSLAQLEALKAEQAAIRQRQFE